MQKNEAADTNTKKRIRTNSSAKLIALKKILPRAIALKSMNHLKRVAERNKKGPCMVATDFLRFLNQRTGWMGHDGVLVPPQYCHLWGFERSFFSRELQKTNDFLAKLGWRPDRPLSEEAERSLITLWPTSFDLLRNLAVTRVGNKLKVLSKREFQASLNIMFRLHRQRLPIVEDMMPNAEANKWESQRYLGLKLGKKHVGLWGSCRQVNWNKVFV